MDQTVSKRLCEQVNKEFYSAYLYLEFANFFEEKGLDGFANWYQVQAKEEMDHAMLFYQYLHNNNQKIALEAAKQSGRACVPIIHEAVSFEKALSQMQQSDLSRSPPAWAPLSGSGLWHTDSGQQTGSPASG